MTTEIINCIATIGAEVFMFTLIYCDVTSIGPAELCIGNMGFINGYVDQEPLVNSDGPHFGD